MGDCISCSNPCCNTENIPLNSELSSPRPSSFKIDLSPRIPQCRKSTTPEIPLELPDTKAGYRRSSCIAQKKGFLAKAREKTRKSTVFQTVTNPLSGFEGNDLRSYTCQDEEFLNNYQQRISLESPIKNEGDYDIF